MIQKIPYGLPPHSLEIERRVIGALMFIGKPSALPIQQAMLLLDTESFYTIKTQCIFNTIQERFNNNKPFDFVSISSLIEDRSHGLYESLREEYYTANLLPYDVIILNNYRTLRRQLRIMVDAINAAQTEKSPDNALETLSYCLQKMSQSSTSLADKQVKTYEECIEEELTNSDNDTSLIFTTIPGLPPVPNRALITIAGRTGHGKTFFALYVMDKLIDVLPDKQHLYFNLEMHPKMMLDRHAILLGAKGEDSRSRISHSSHLLLARNVSLVSIPMITIDEIEAISRIAALKQPIGVIVVDYLGLITSKAKSDRKDLEQNNIAKRLAALSIELDCVVICLIQVNREFKNRPVGERCPVPSDAAEGMGSVHSASWWIGIDQPYNDNEDPEYQHVFQVQCRKNRTESGLFKLDLQFRNGIFEKRLRPFSPNSGINYKSEVLVP